jgi:tetratricopeptide (TPR) repeat protein
MRGPAHVLAVGSDLLKALANPHTQAILTLLHTEPSYPRKVARILSLPETEVARRLRALQRLGLVTATWQHVGKNVKVYSPTTARMDVQFGAAGITVQLYATEATTPRRIYAFDPLPAAIPKPQLLLGRTAELAVLGGPSRVVVVEGLAGIGKTSLLAAHAAGLAPHDVYWQSLSGLESLEWLANTLAIFHARRGDGRWLDQVETARDNAALHRFVLSGLDVDGVTAILDDVHRVQDPAVAALVTDAVNSVRSGRLLLGTRGRVPHRPDAAVTRLRLDDISDDAIRELFVAKGQELNPALMPRVRAEVGGHPLALNLFIETAKANAVAVETLLDRIPERDLERYLLQEIYDGLAEGDRRALGLASLFDDRFTAEDLGALLGHDPQPVLARLRARLLVQPLPDGFRLHEVLKNLFYHMLHDKRGLHARAARYFARRGDLAGRIEAMHHFLAADHRDEALALLREDLDLRDYELIDSGYHNLYWKILASFSRDQVPDDHGWALIEDERGDILLHREEPAAALAHYEEAARGFAAAGKPARCADVAWKRALALRGLGRSEEAVTLCEAHVATVPGASQEARRLGELLAELRL